MNYSRSRLGMYVVLCLLVMMFAWPLQWYPDNVRLFLAEFIGAEKYRSPQDSMPAGMDHSKPFDRAKACPEDLSGWRDQQIIEGVEISASHACVGR